MVTHMKNLRTKFTAFLVGFAFVISGAALAETFNLFSPATGILKGNSRSYVTTAANASDVVALWSGTCSASTFLAGNGTCQPEAGGGTVTSISQGTGITATPNPIVSTGTIAVDQTFSPVWTGNHTFNGAGAIKVAGNGATNFTGRAVGITASVMQIEGTGNTSSAVSLVRNNASSGGGVITLGHSRSNVTGGFDIVSNSDALGQIDWAGADGVNLTSLAARVVAAVDGAPGASDMPGRLVFMTTPDASATPAERFRISSAGGFGLNGANFGTAGQVLTSQGNAPPTWTTIAAGGTPGGANTQIQYNNAGAFAGSAKFAWDDGSNRLTVGAATGSATITAPVNPSGTGSASNLTISAGSVTGSNTTGAGGGLFLFGGAPNGANFGGTVTIKGGEGAFSQNAGGGSVEITGGEGNGNAQAGAVYITGGAPQGTGIPGDIGIQAGSANEQRGGHVEITAGDANSQGSGNFNGGNVTISAGAGIGTGTGGNVSLNAGNGAFIVSTNGTNRFFINPSGSWGLAGGTQGTTGQVLTSQGTGAPPIWATPAGGGGPSGASATSNAAFSFANSSESAGVPLAAEEFDTGNFHDNTTNNSRVLLPTTTGYASCSAVVSILSGTLSANAGGANNYHYNLFLRKNGSTSSHIAVASDYWVRPAGGSATPGPFIFLSTSAAMIPATAGDYVEMTVYTTGAFDSNSSVVANTGSTANMTRLTCTAVK